MDFIVEHEITRISKITSRHTVTGDDLKGWAFIRTPMCGLKARGITFDQIKKAFAAKGWDCVKMSELTDENKDDDILVIRESQYNQ